ncbi:hypothetical protein RHMOL_Rhmol07G0300000 [Rhododendron molle]|uniref:Uncharacterized protein n=1 Tax=Rhododendron molle TaxID=49168 RepID=A0ACC0N6R8_RHOML|nr:hypothetical protein RHMOL_Rhmol07G0300000 [Rhododendron molle]
MVNSANVTGGKPLLVHMSLPPQSPVVHFPLFDASKLQPVWAQNRPDQPGGAMSWFDAPGASEKPTPPRTEPFLTNMLGQIV